MLENAADESRKLFVVSTKSDLKLDISKTLKFCDKYNLRLFQCSAKDNTGIKEVMQHLAKVANGEEFKSQKQERQEREELRRLKIRN